MNDIVERIKDAENATHALFNHIFQDAREEIERLRVENEALRAEVIHIKEVEFPRKAQAVADGWRGKCERLEAKIAEMERQEPGAWMLNCQTLGGDTGWFLSWTQSGVGMCNRLSGEENERKLYALPGAHPKLESSVPDGWKLVPKAVAYLDLGTGGYMDIGTDLTDEALAAIPKGRHMLGIVGTYGVDGYVPAQPAPSVPEGWLRAIDEALVTAHIGVATAHDTYEQAKAKLDNLIGFHVDIATDPAVNGGWKLVPIEPTTEIRKAMHYAYWKSPQLPYHDGSPELWNAAYAAMLAAAPETKP